MPTTSKYNKTNNGGIYSENQIQKDDIYCAAYCLYVLYFTQNLDFKNAVLNWYYQTFKPNERKKLKVIQLSSKSIHKMKIRKAREAPPEHSVLIQMVCEASKAVSMKIITKRKIIKTIPRIHK